jgi:hypothetical protein
MWILTIRGFYSIVKRDGQLCVRARVEDDLARLRELMPALGPVIKGAGSDYPFRAFISPEAFAASLPLLAAEITYPNFKDAVAQAQGEERAAVYGQVWEELMGLEPRLETAWRARWRKPDGSAGVR